jgi:hypothetical protein
MFMLNMTSVIYEFPYVLDICDQPVFYDVCAWNDCDVCNVQVVVDGASIHSLANIKTDQAKPCNDELVKFP